MGESVIRVQSFFRGDYDAIFTAGRFGGTLSWEIGSKNIYRVGLSNNELAEKKLKMLETKSILLVSLSDSLRDFPKEIIDIIHSKYMLKEKSNLLEFGNPYQPEYIVRNNLYNIAVLKYEKK